jgi:predicted lipoprotein
MKINKLILPFIVLVISSTFIACSDDDSNGGDNGNANNFDRSLMLVNWADNIIIPSYENFSEETTALKEASDAFLADQSMENLTSLREEWEDAYISWQNVAIFNIGPAQDVVMRTFLNTYPTNTSNIESFIENSNYNLLDPNLNDEQGFPALDYLLYGAAENETQILELFTSAPNAGNRRQYLEDVVNRINSLSSQVLEDWQTGYRDVFVENSGSSANSSTNRMANVFMEFYEVRLRNGKIGFPAGVYSGGDPQPGLVEALYNKDLSGRLSLEALRAHQDFFNGTAANVDSSAESFADYLDFLNTMKEGENLSTLINEQYQVSESFISALNPNFFEQINTDNTSMLQAFESLQDNVVYLKSDMFSALSIALEFDSGDGD